MATWTRWSAALAASTALAAVCGGAQAQNAAGEWHGTTNGPFGVVPIGVTIKAKAGGGYEGTWVSPKSTVPLKDIKLDKNALTFSNGTGSYSGRWDATRKAWVGQWTPHPVVQMGFVQASPGAGPPSPPPSSLPSFPPPAPLDLVLTAGKP